jgi:uncharacterized cofD-like protein
MAAPKRKKIVVMGGGTGTFTVLSGLKNYPHDLTAIVAMADDGGSTGVLRDELGVLPPGDVRQCLVALSSSDELMRTLMSYRFSEGTLRGHSMGNLLLSALEKITGRFDLAVEKASEVLRVRGRVVPATLDKVSLMARVNGRKVKGQKKIDETRIAGRLERIYLHPSARANPSALRALREADAIVIGPGNFYSSLIPNLLVKGIPEAIRRSKAKKILVCNLMARTDQLAATNVRAFTEAMERYLGGAFDVVIYNNKRPRPQLLSRYEKENEALLQWNEVPDAECVGGDLVARSSPKQQRTGDLLVRSLIRHDSDKLASLIAAHVRRR